MFGSTLVHATDAADVCTLPAVTLGYRPEPGVAVFSWRIFRASTFDETLTPTGGITCSALHRPGFGDYYGFS
jgi:hypothetical protein